MSVKLAVKVEGVEELQRRLNRVKPETNPQWVSRALVKCALLIQAEIQENQLIRGSDDPLARAHPKRLTSRTGRLRDSIAVDRSGLPDSILIGSNVVYGAIHEFGGAAGRNLAATLPARPYMQPGLEAVANQLDGIFQREVDREIAKS